MINITLFKSLSLAALTGFMAVSCQPACNAKQNQAETAAITYQIEEIPEDNHNFFVVNDLGRNGYYQQKPIAELLGTIAENIDIEFVAALGDTHHFEGVASTSDPLWMTNYESIYSHPELMIDWYAICGNHEYRGNTQAVLDYTNVSRRWNAPSKYYSKTVEAGDNEMALLVFIDTAPLIDKYRDDSEKYPDAVKEDMQKQLNWLDQTLSSSNAKWKIVMGHHPVYAETKKSQDERDDLQNRVAPILEKNKVNAYMAGHIHNFQHIKPEGATVNYFVNSSGSLSRKVKAIEGTQFCSPEAGFSLVSMGDDKIDIHMINGEGKTIYKYTLN